MSDCRSCGAEIIWITTHPGGRSMPLDPKPHPEGNVLVDMDARRGVVLSVKSRQVVLEETPDEPLYRSHFATCPNAESHRRGSQARVREQ
jgi:hypothetical protein